MVSVIIPVYNEEKTISECLTSLNQQSFKDCEIIVVDDGSTDNSKFKIKNSELQFKIKNLKLLSQRHQGPGPARNLGAKQAKGDILVFVDSDMTFDKDFIKNLIDPIVKGKSRGTFTNEEYVSNWDNVWARCWNYNEGIGGSRRIPKDFPDQSPVFRAILKSEFERAGGFDDIGFTDDWTLSRKLNYQATSAKDAICYHQNPDNLADVYIQARWIGKNEFIIGSFLRQVIGILRFNPLIQTIRGLIISLKYKESLFLIFQLVYYWGITVSIVKSFLGDDKSK